MFIPSAILLTIWSTYALRPSEGPCGKILVKIVTLLAILVFLVAFNFGHVYNGSIGLDQTILSELSAIWVVVNCYYFFREPIMNNALMISRGCKLEPDLPLWRYILTFGVGSVIAIGIGVLVYFINQATFEPDPKWATNVTQKCPDYFGEPYQTVDRFYTAHTFSSFGQVGYAFGAYCGLILQHKLFEGMSLIVIPSRKRGLKMLIRTILLLAFCVGY